MKKKRVTIRPEGSIESILSLGPTIGAIRHQNPDAEVVLLAEECFREAAALVPGIDLFLSVGEPEGKFYDLSQRSGESWGQESMDWKCYLQSCATLPTNSYHQIDILKKAAGVEKVEANYELNHTGEDASQPASITGGDGLRIALCAASMGINELQSVLEGLSRVQVKVAVHLVGTVSERRKSSVLLSAWENRISLVDLCGRQTFAQTAETYRQCDIAITAPGSGALLSSGYGTFTICVDDGRNPLLYPYGHGHLIIQRDSSDEFHSALSRMVGEIVDYAVLRNSGTIPSLDQWQEFADERIDNYLAHIRLLASQRIETIEDQGSVTEMFLRPLIFFGSDHGDVLQAFYRPLWEHSLQGRDIPTSDLSTLHHDSITRIQADLKPMEQLYELANFGRTFSLFVRDSLIKADQSKAQADAAKLQETEELIYALGKAANSLSPLVNFHEKKQRLLSAESPIDLAEQMAQEFSAMQERVLVLLDLAKTLFHTTLQNEAAPSAPEENPSHG